MSEAQLTKFLEAVKVDAGLQERLKAAANLAAAVAIAVEAGFDVTTDDLAGYQASGAHELSDQQLEEAAGGYNPFTDAYTGPVPDSIGCLGTGDLRCSEAFKGDQ